MLEFKPNVISFLRKKGNSDDQIRGFPGSSQGRFFENFGNFFCFVIIENRKKIL